MPADITMPQLSDTMTEGTLVKWLKKEGDKVSSGEEIAEIETDKATMPMEAFDAGTLAAVLVSEGEKVKVGQVIAVIATGSENPAEVKKKAASGATSAASAPASRKEVAATRKPVAAMATAATYPGTAGGEMREPDGDSHQASREPAHAVPPLHSHDNGKNRIHISPLARRIAEAKRIDLSTIKGSGPNGRIVKQDLLNASVQAAPAAKAAASSNGGTPAPVGSGQTQVIPLTKMRSAIAKALQASKQNLPHFYETIDVDVEELTGLRAQLNEILEPEKIRLSIGDFISKATAATLLKHPAVNATFNGTEITRHGDVHMGFAVSVPDGLIVPVLRNIHLMGLKEIRQRSLDLYERARAQRLKQDELTGGTFTISNLGSMGIREFSAIINPPQVAILAVAAAEKRPVVRNNQIVARTMLTLTLSADHRVVDGATAAEFLKTLKSLLEQPGMMLV
jgi:pyruvate dehydrogenase E2 component (dihydrolipoamide acetyltransferase)